MSGILLNIIACIGIIGQFFIEHIIGENKTKKKIGIFLVLVSAISIWGSFYLQKLDKDELSQNLSDITNSNVILTTKLGKMEKSNIELTTTIKERDNDIKAIREQNDSLKISIAELKEQQEEFKIVQQNSIREIERIRVADNVQPLTRGISAIDKIKMIEILKQHKGKTIDINSVLGDSEAFQFAAQLKEVFIAAGWKVKGFSQSLFAKPVQGIKIRVKNDQYPKRVKEIIKALNVLRIKVEGWYGKNLEKDEIELVVGSK